MFTLNRLTTALKNTSARTCLSLSSGPILSSYSDNALSPCLGTSLSLGPNHSCLPPSTSPNLSQCKNQSLYKSPSLSLRSGFGLGSGPSHDIPPCSCTAASTSSPMSTTLGLNDSSAHSASVSAMASASPCSDSGSGSGPCPRPSTRAWALALALALALAKGILDSQQEKSATPKACSFRVRAQVVKTLCFLILLLWSFNSYAANGPSFDINLAQILNAFEAEILSMRRTIYIFSKNLIFYLGVFAIACRGIYLILQQGTLFTFACEFVKLIFLFGLIRFFLLNGYDFATDIINSLLALINGNSLGTVTTTDALNEFFEFVSDFAQTLAPNNALFFIIFMALMYVAICFLFILYIIRYLSVLFILVFGSISIVFAVFRQTRFIVFNFVSLSLGCALKFVALCFIIRIGEKIVSAIIVDMRVDIMMGLTLSLQDAGFVLLVLSLVCAAAFYLPLLLSKICMPMVNSATPIRV